MSFSKWIISRIDEQTLVYLILYILVSVDLAQYEIFCTKFAISGKDRTSY